MRSSILIVAIRNLRKRLIGQAERSTAQTVVTLEGSANSKIERHNKLGTSARPQVAEVAPKKQTLTSLCETGNLQKSGLAFSARAGMT
jgi:hypothetical protein